jgi:hypothetical protein
MFHNPLILKYRQDGFVRLQGSSWEDKLASPTVEESVCLPLAIVCGIITIRFSLGYQALSKMVSTTKDWMTAD